MAAAAGRSDGEEVGERQLVHERNLTWLRFSHFKHAPFSSRFLMQNGNLSYKKSPKSKKLLNSVDFSEFVDVKEAKDAEAVS